MEFARLYSLYSYQPLSANCTSRHQVLWYINSTVCQALKSRKVKSPRCPIFRLGQKVCTFPNFCQKIRKTSKKYSFSKSPQNVVTICTAGSYKIFRQKSEKLTVETNTLRKVPDEIRNILSGWYFLESLLTDKPLPDKNKKYRISISAAEPIADSHCAGLITAL